MKNCRKGGNTFYLSSADFVTRIKNTAVLNPIISVHQVIIVRLYTGNDIVRGTILEAFRAGLYSIEKRGRIDQEPAPQSLYPDQ